MKLSPQDQIWNRACLESGGTSPRTGDQALAALLLSHGLVMNGDVVHALECLSDSEIAAAIRGFEYFGLMEASNVFRQIPDDSEETELRLNEMYWSAVPDDDTLVQAFRVKLLASPEEFSPTESASHA